MSDLIKSAVFAIILLVISSLPILNGVQLPDINSGREFVLDTRKFKPIQGIAETMRGYATALVSNLEELIKLKNGEERTQQKIPNRWSYYKGNPNLQYYVTDINECKEYGIKAIAANSEVERFSVNSLGEAQWKRDGSLPISIKPNPLAQNTNVEVKQESITTGLKPLVAMLNETRFDPQRVARILINEAQLLLELGKSLKDIKGPKNIGKAKIVIRKGDRCSTYILKESNRLLIIKVNKLTKEIESITKSAANASYSLNLKPDNGGTIDKEATLTVSENLNKKKLVERSRDNELRALLGATEHPLNEVKLYAVGTNRVIDKIDAKQHRKTLLSNENLPTLLDRTGIIYNNDDASLKDFFEYTKMPKGSVSFAFADSVNSCLPHNLNGKQIRLERFGLPGLRAQIFGHSDAGIKSIRDLEKYTRAIGIPVCNDETDKAIYRWGIRASAEELKKAGIFYVVSTNKGEKDKIYLVDIGERDNWGNIKIEKIYGNQKSNLPLKTYPQQKLLAKVFPEFKTTNINIQLRKSTHLKKMLEAIGFEVPNVIETEKFIEENSEARNFVAARLEAATTTNSVASKGKFKTLVGVSIAQKLLAQNGYAVIDEIQDPESPMSRPWLLFQNGSIDKKLGYVSLSEANRSKTQKQIIEHAKVLTTKTQTKVTPVEIKVENLDLLHRTGKLALTELAA